MWKSYKGLIFATGLAMFSMFFGAGNVVFPLSLGRVAQGGNLFASIGLVLTAVIIPLAGVTGLLLFQGDYDAFFRRLGRIPGDLVVLAILLLIGPAGATPRTITLSHATISTYAGSMPLWIFSLIACCIIFLFTYRQSKVLDLLGYVLTPILIGCLSLIVVLGMISPPPVGSAPYPAFQMFMMGLIKGYNTMDLLGAFFFSHVILYCLKREVDDETASNPRAMLKLSSMAGLIAATLLGAVYVGFSTLTSRYGSQLLGTPDEQLLGALAYHILGSHAGIVACGAVALACLTTAIALCSVFAEYIQVDLLKERISYRNALIITLGATFAVSTLNFEGIATFLEPILEVCYPALIVLTACNIMFKLWGFSYVKAPVLLTFLCSLAMYLWAGI